MHSKEATLPLNTAHLVEVENNVQLAHVGEVLVKELHKQMNCLQIGQLIVVDIDTLTSCILKWVVL
jgi:hypothetical protein